MSDAEFRIEYTITRRLPGADEDDFTEVGFGSSGAWANVEQCAHMVVTDIQNGHWETSEGMPDPEELR
jgi:hypothetical protein